MTALVSNPKVSVIIPVFNGEKYISKAIESVLSQTYKNIEIVVANDGSTDSTFEKIKPYLSEITYIFQENAGLSEARNIGIRKSTGELIAFLDHDDMWLPEKTEKQVNYILSDPQRKFVHCSVKYINHLGEIIEPSGYWKNLKFNSEVANVKDIFMHYAMLPSTMMIKREVFDEVGFLNPEFKSCEGYDLCLRIAFKYKLTFIDEPLIGYRLHDANKSKNFIRFDFYRIRTLESFLEMHPSAYSLIGKNNICSRLFNLYFEMAKNLLWLKDYTEARKYFLKAYKKHPANTYCLKNVIWCSLSPSQRKALSWYAKKINTMFMPEQVKD